MDHNLSLNQINTMCQGSLLDHLGIEFTFVSDGKVEAIMPVDVRTIQPVGILHGGASIALAETVAGFGSQWICEEDEVALGMQISASHVSSIRSGEVHAVASLIHHGKRSHVWNVDILSDDQRLISTVRVTNLITKQQHV
jgi:uncharacterized protein (TIGR00369 family)